MSVKLESPESQCNPAKHGIQEVWLQPLPMPVIAVYRLAAMKGKLQEKNK